MGTIAYPRPQPTKPHWQRPVLYVGLALFCNLLLLFDWKFAIGGAAGVLVGTYVFFHPRVGLYLTVLTLPLELAGNFARILPFMNLSPTKLFGALTLAVWILHLLLGRLRFRMPHPAGWLGSFVACCALSLLGHEQLSEGAQALVRLSTTFFFYVLVINLVDSAVEFRRLLACLVTVSCLTFGLAIAQRYMPSSSFEMRSNWDDESQQRYGVERHTLDAGAGGVVERSSGTSQHSIVNAVNTAIIFPCLVGYLWFARSNGSRFVLLVGIGLALGAAVVSFSRTGFLTYAVIIPMILALGLARITAVRLIAVMMLVLAALPFVPSVLWERVLSPASYTIKNSESLRIRLDLWASGANIVRDHFLTGMGVGNTKMLGRYWDDPTNGHYITVHNAYLQMAMESGFPSVIVLAIFFWLTFRLGNRAVLQFRAAGSDDWIWVRSFQIGMSSLLFSGFFLDFMNQSFKNAWFLMAGIVVFHELSVKALVRREETLEPAVRSPNDHRMQA